MSETDLQLGGGYTYQWESAILLALNYFFEPVRYGPTLFDLVCEFLGEVDEIHLEGVAQVQDVDPEGEGEEIDVELEDIALVSGHRQILIQVKTKQAEGQRWTPADPLLLKALYRFYDSRFLEDQPATVRFVFLTNRPFNPDLVKIKDAIRAGALGDCPEVGKLGEHLGNYARRKKDAMLDVGRFRQMLAHTTLVEYLAVDAVKANIQAKLQAYGRPGWQQAHALLFEHFSRQSTHLGGGIVTRESIVEVLGPKAHPSRRDLELAYLDRLLAKFGRWRDGYTPLVGVAEVRAAPNGQRHGRRLPFIPPSFEKLEEYGLGQGLEVRRVPVDDLLEAVVEHRRILLLGEPGSGKTTTLERLAYDYAGAARKDGRKPLPLLVSLGGYTDSGSFDAYLAGSLGPLAPYLKDYRASGRLILLLDGLNEMPRVGYAVRVGRIQDALDLCPEGTVVVVTCRALDYIVKLKGLQKVDISLLDEARILTFLRNYLGETDGERLFWTMAGGDEMRALWETWQRAGATWAGFWTAEKMPDPVYQKTSAAQDRLWARMRDEPPGLLVLGRVAYLLSLIAAIYDNQGDLPANRGLLFRAFAGMLLDRESARHPEQWIDAAVQQDALAALAHAMQAEGGRGTEVERAWAAKRLHEAVTWCDTERLLYLAKSATLLHEDGARVRFYHQLLQEYFAARKMGRRLEDGESLEFYWPRDRWWEPSGWEETAILLAGMEPDASALLEALADANPVVAARCLVEGGVQPGESVRPRIVESLVGVISDGGLWAVARARAGDALARLGDPRHGVGLRLDGLPDIAWCQVPAGPFLMGSDQGQDELARENEFPQHSVDLAAYSVARYPVTNAQYAVFVEDGGYNEDRYWTGEGWRWKGKKSGPETQGGAFDLPNHSVVGVTWYEAVAFCRWLTERLRKRGNLRADREVRLPTEAEWEKAARGTDGCLYPWGDEFDPQKCNMRETGIRATSAVGCFPGGASPFGVEDLSGNVLEWCGTKWRGGYEEPAEESLEGDALRVLRGGSFFSNQRNVRCAYRNGFYPNYWHRYYGFRVVVAPVPSAL